MMPYKLLVAFSTLTSLHATEYTITKKVSYDILKESYGECDKNATSLIEKDAIERYVGCQADLSKYSIDFRHINFGDRLVAQDHCSVESTVEVSSDFLDEHDYYLGSHGVICGGFDPSIEKNNVFWNSFELGVFVGFSGSQNEVEMSSSDAKIFVEYASVPLVGINGAYLHKIFNSQYVGAKLFLAKGFEVQPENSSTITVRNDGNPSILRVGTGAFWGYRYHVKTDFSLGANYLYDSLTRNYTNRTYTANVSKFNVEAGAGYLVLPYLKVWGTVASDLSANLGLSWVY